MTRQHLDSWMKELDAGTARPDDVAFVFEQEILRTGDVTLLSLAPTSVVNAFHRDIDAFLRNGEWVISAAGGSPRDASAAMARLCTLLKDAGMLQS